MAYCFICNGWRHVHSSLRKPVKGSLKTLQWAHRHILYQPRTAMISVGWSCSCELRAQLWKPLTIQTIQSLGSLSSSTESIHVRENTLRLLAFFMEAISVHSCWLPIAINVLHSKENLFHSEKYSCSEGCPQPAPLCSCIGFSMLSTIYIYYFTWHVFSLLFPSPPPLFRDSQSQNGETTAEWKWTLRSLVLSLVKLFDFFFFFLCSKSVSADAQQPIMQLHANNVKKKPRMLCNIAKQKCY